MRLLLALAAVLAFAPAASAQVPLKGELARLSFMLGDWRGTGWVRYQPDGPAREARVVAQGQARLAGATLGWSSTATSTDREAAVVQRSDLSVRFRADSAVFRGTVHHDGQPVSAWVRVGECQVAWGYTSPADPQSLFRFSSRVEGGTRRVETGERSTDAGQTWWVFSSAEMTGLGIAACEAPASAPTAP